MEGPLDLDMITAWMIWFSIIRRVKNHETFSSDFNLFFSSSLLVVIFYMVLLDRKTKLTLYKYK